VTVGVRSNTSTPSRFPRGRHGEPITLVTTGKSSCRSPARVVDVVHGVLRGDVPVGFRGSDERIEGAPAVAIGVLVFAGACWVLYKTVTG